MIIYAMLHILNLLFILLQSFASLTADLWFDHTKCILEIHLWIDLSIASKMYLRKYF